MNDLTKTPGSGKAAAKKPKAASKAGSFGPVPDEFRKTWPKLSAAIDAWLAVNPGKAPAAIRIASRRDGFRRCDVEHPRAATDHEFARFDPAVLERFFDEPVLIVELV